MDLLKISRDSFIVLAAATLLAGCGGGGENSTTTAQSSDEESVSPVVNTTQEHTAQSDDDWSWYRWYKDRYPDSYSDRYTDPVDTVPGDNAAPIANAQNINTDESRAKAITLTGSDADGDTLTYSITATPGHGTLSGTAPNLTYTPTSGYNGIDSFTFTVNDGTVSSIPAVVYITVNLVVNTLEDHGQGKDINSPECLFCHVDGGLPEWNDQPTNPSFEPKAYDSDYLRRIDYPRPTDRELDLFSHPVGYEFDADGGTPIVFDQGGSTTTELRPADEVATTPVKLFDSEGKKFVECASCHDPLNSTDEKFLRVDTSDNHAENARNTCLSCHAKIGWTGSIHQTASNTYTSESYGTQHVSDLGCINCHMPHGGEGKPLLRKVEQNTCYQGAADSVATAACHGVDGAKDIDSVLSKQYGHPTNRIDGVHTGLDAVFGTDDAVGANAGKGVDWANSKHAECMDCHNPHRAQRGNHVVDDSPAKSADASGWYPTSPTNLVSDVLKGVSGVEPYAASTPRWNQPRTIATKKEAEKEYQICMKCHSYWGLGAVSQGSSANSGATNFATSSDPSINYTDQAFEFNPNNRSVHPVVMTLNNQPGSYAPKALNVRQMKTPWKNVGNQTMMCSDCHGNNEESTGGSRGPHGSSHKFMLKGDRKEWPVNSSTGKPWKLKDVRSDTNERLFCLNCHNIFDERGANSEDSFHGFKRDKDDWSELRCVNCHVAVPHGSAMSRLLGQENMDEPYNWNGNSIVVQRFRKATHGSDDGGYDKDNARINGNFRIPENGEDCDSHDDKCGDSQDDSRYDSRRGSDLDGPCDLYP